MGMDERKARIILAFNGMDRLNRTAYYVAGKFDLCIKTASELLNTMIAEEFVTGYQDTVTRKKYYKVTEHGVVSAKKFMEDLVTK